MSKRTEVRDTIWGDDQLPLVLMAYPIPAEGTPDYYAVDLLNTALSGGQSSRLNRAVVDDQELGRFLWRLQLRLRRPRPDHCLRCRQHRNGPRRGGNRP